MSTNEPVVITIGNRNFRVWSGQTTTERILNYQEAKALGERNEVIYTND